MADFARVCLLCDWPVPVGLAMLQKCKHWGHAPCLSAYVNQHGHCPIDNCTMSATEGEVLVLHVDSPQAQGNDYNPFGQADQQKNVIDTLDVIFQRLGSDGRIASAPKGEREELMGIVQRLSTTNGSENEAEWSKLKAFFRTASPFILAAFFGLCCWYFPPLLSFGSSLLQSLSSLVMGLASTIYAYLPEFAISGVAFFSSFMVKSKLADN